MAISIFAIPMTTLAQGSNTTINSGNTAWLTVATILVMLMTIPGLALFYGGLVRQKNVLSILMQCLMCTAVVSLMWIFFGYSFVFGKGLSGSPLGFFIGGFDKIFLPGCYFFSSVSCPCSGNLFCFIPVHVCCNHTSIDYWRFC